MVEFINRLTESQASDKVHKVLRSDPDKKQNQPEQEKSDAEKKDESQEPKDEVVLSKTGTEVEKVKELSPDQPTGELEIKKLADEKQKQAEPDGHIDVTA